MRSINDDWGQRCAHPCSQCNTSPEMAAKSNVGPAKAIIRDGDYGIPAHKWHGTIFLFLEQIAPSWRHISALIHARVGGSRVDLVTLRDQWWQLRDSLTDFSQRWQEIGQARRPCRALLCNLMLWTNGKGVLLGSKISLISHWRNCPKS